MSESIWTNGGFKDQLLAEIEKIKIGDPGEWTNYMGPVMYVFVVFLLDPCADHGAVVDPRTTRSPRTSRKRRMREERC